MTGTEILSLSLSPPPLSPSLSPPLSFSSLSLSLFLWSGTLLSPSLCHFRYDTCFCYALSPSTAKKTEIVGRMTFFCKELFEDYSKYYSYLSTYKLLILRCLGNYFLGVMQIIRDTPLRGCRGSAMCHRFSESKT
jgi:hypothetical protein